MRTLADDRDFNVKVWKEQKRAEPLQATNDSTRWRARCMHVGCPWLTNELRDHEAVQHASQLHADSTGHPVRLRATVEFDCGIVRSRSAIERR